MLREIGILTKADLAAITKGLRAIPRDLRRASCRLPVELEDIHMVIEKALIDRDRRAGAKLHTGRSRNDQVALDLRLWARDAVDELARTASHASAGLCGPGRKVSGHRHARIHAPAAGPADTGGPRAAGVRGNARP